jgi:hypothetical protein
MPQPSSKYTNRTTAGTLNMTELHSYSVHESAGTAAAAACRVTDGDGGTTVLYIELGANGSETKGGLMIGSSSATSLFLAVDAGSVEFTAHGH